MCECVALGSATRCMRIYNATLYDDESTRVHDGHPTTRRRAPCTCDCRSQSNHNPTSPAVSGSKRQGSPCTLGERPTATHPRELEYLVAYFIASRASVFHVHSSQIAVTGRERGRGTIILHGRRSTSCCPLSGKETVRTAAIGQRTERSRTCTLKVNFELWSVSAGRGGQWGGPRHKYASEGLCVLPGWQINVNVTVTATLTLT
jgi:hypothetical protein